MPNIDRLIEEKQEYAYKNPDNKKIYTPMYKAYNKAYFDLISDKLDLDSDFKNLSDTSWFEQYMVNTFQFTAAKDRTEMKMLQQNVFDENHVKRSFSEFKEIAQPIDDLHKTWCRTEYDYAAHQAVMADQWNDMQRDKDINPNFIYHCADSPCEICDPMDGEIFSLDDDEAADLSSGNHFNCLCWSEPTDEEVTGQGKDYIDNVPAPFQGNSAEDGIFNLSGSSYGEVLPNANDADSDMFSGTDSEYDNETELSAQVEYKTLLHTKKYSTLGIYLASKELKEKHPVKGDDLIFQNKEFKLNVRLPHETLLKINKRSGGVENISATLERPDEIYASWTDAEKQKIVKMFYFSHDSKRSYIVETQKGVVIDSYFRSHSDSKKLRKKGILIIK